MVNAQIGGDDFIAGSAVRAGPLDDERDAPAQPVTSSEERSAVHPRGEEDIVVLPPLPLEAHFAPDVLVDVDE